MIFLLFSCLLLEIGTINITCENSDSCDSSDDAPNYLGEYNVNRCEEVPSSTGYAVGDVSPDFELRDQHGEALRLSDFCGNTVLLVGCAIWSSCNQANFEDWYLNYNDDLTIIVLMYENLIEEPPSQADLLDWAEINELTFPIVADPQAEVLEDYLRAIPNYSPGDHGLPTTQVLSPGMIIEALNVWISEEELLQLLD